MFKKGLQIMKSAVIKSIFLPYCFQLSRFSILRLNMVKNFVDFCPDHSALIGLRPLRTSDFESLFSAASDPEIWSLHPDPLRYTRQGFEKYFQSALADDCISLLIFHPVTDEVMGSSRYYRYQDAEKSVFIGFTFLRRKFWGGIWNARLKLAMLDHAFLFCKAVNFEAGMANLRSIAALEKLGATRQLHSDPAKVLFQISIGNWPEIRANLLAKTNNPGC